MHNVNPLVEQIRTTIPLSQIIGRTLRLTRSGYEWKASCPFHQEKTPSFTVNDRKGFFYCFGCGTHGDAITYVMKYHNQSFLEALENLAKDYGLQWDPKNHTPVDPQYEDILKALRYTSEWYSHQLTYPSGEQARTYLKQRQFSDATIQSFALGYAPKQHGLYKVLREQGFGRDVLLKTGLFVSSHPSQEPYDRFRDRVMFPICDMKGHIVAFGGRTMGHSDAKYLNSPDTLLFHKGRLLYYLHYAKKHIKHDNPPIVVEGYCDVITLVQAGFHTAIAPLGTAMTTDHLALLWNHHHQPILCFDGDAAGQRALLRTLEKALEWIGPQKTLTFCHLPSSEDPDTMILNHGEDLFRKTLKESTPFVDVLWDSLMHSQGESSSLTPEQKVLLKQKIVTTIQRIQDKETRFFYQKEFLDRFHRKGLKKTPLQQESMTQKINQYNLINKKNIASQKILLAIVIKHPTLLKDIIEQFADLEFTRHEWQTLKDYMINHAHILKEPWDDALREKGFQQCVDEILSHDMHLAFLMNRSQEDQILDYWKSVWRQHVLQRTNDQESKVLLQSLKDSLDDANWKKLKVLKQI